MSTFIDHTKVNLKAGDGGDGMVAFRREKYAPDGGPAGGDGGRGGDIIFVVDEGLRTLLDFRYNRHFKAERGQHGMSKSKHGRGSKDLYISVPPGTTIKNAETGAFLGDLTENGEELIVAKGGRGGRGNKRFATPKNPAPEISENGEPGEELEVDLELKVLADVGLVGFPSVGKSTLLSAVTAATPKIGDYPFTTLAPQLGMVDVSDHRSFVIADLPGLIKGASQGLGLGIDFLRHIERTRVLLHVIDMGAQEGRNPYEDYLAINHELESYDLKLLERPQIIVANKMDLEESTKNLEEFKRKLQEDGKETPIFSVSAFTKQGLRPLMEATADLIDRTPSFPIYDEEEIESSVIYKYEPSEEEFNVTRDDNGVWVLGGEKLLRLYKMTNMDREEAVMRFARQMRGMGIDEKLRELGAVNGDIVRIEEFEFEFVD